MVLVNMGCDCLLSFRIDEQVKKESTWIAAVQAMQTDVQLVSGRSSKPPCLELLLSHPDIN